MNLKSGIDLQMILKILYWGARLNFMFSLPQLHTKSLCVLALQNSQFEASTSSRPQTVNFEALGHKAIILRNKEVPKKNAPHKPRDVTRPTVMVKRYGFRGTLSIKYKIDFWNNPITVSVLVWNQVVLNQSQQLGYLSSKLMLSWDCPFNLWTESINWIVYGL